MRKNLRDWVIRFVGWRHTAGTPGGSDAYTNYISGGMILVMASKRNIQQKLSHASYDYVHLNRKINDLYKSYKDIEKFVSNINKKDKRK